MFEVQLCIIYNYKTQRDLLKMSLLYAKSVSRETITKYNYMRERSVKFLFVLNYKLLVIVIERVEQVSLIIL